MKKLMHLIFIFIVVNSAISINAAEFNHYFKDKTMRVDYFHSGTATEEHFAIDRIVSDGAWAGSLSHLVDEVNFGLYQFDVINPDDGTIIYSRGFASVLENGNRFPKPANNGALFMNQSDFHGRLSR
jgi:hypothetical protein